MTEYKKVVKENIMIEDVLSVVSSEYLNLAKDFFSFGEEHGLKLQIRFANADKTYKCVFSKVKPRRVVFTLDVFTDKFRVKANLYGIDSYLNDCSLTVNVLAQLQNNAWNCHRHEGNTCNGKCRGGIPLTTNGETEYKCIGGAFVFKDLSSDEWQQIIRFIEREL